MEPIKFKHHNIVFAENQKEYKPLPALKLKGPEGQVISCWKLTFKERIKILFFGVLWFNSYSFNKPLTPIFLTTKRKEVFTLPKDSLSRFTKFKLFIRNLFNHEKKK